MHTPAAAVIAECLNAHSLAAPRSRLARFAGRSPLTAESRPWYLGALGELEVAQQLSRLPSEWFVAHSLPVGTRGSDIDHLLVGPPGVFTVNTKFHEDARIWVGSRRLLVNGQKTDHVRNARFEAKRVAQILGDMGPVPVTPIVTVVGARELIIREQPADVVVVKAASLVRWLLRQPGVVDPALLGPLREAASAPGRWSEFVFDPANSSRFLALQREVRAAKRVRMMWGSALLLGTLIIGGSLTLPLLLRFLGY
jgi:hypothetical protein